MSGAFKAVGDIAGGLAGAVTKPVTGILQGAGQVLTGHPIQGLSTAVGGVVQGSASVLKGGLGAVKHVAGDPLLMGVAGFATMGIGGAIAAPLLGKLASGVAGGAENAVGRFSGLDGQQQLAGQNNQANFGPQNAYMAQGNVGQMAPPGGQMMDPSMMGGGQMSGMMPPGGQMMDPSMMGAGQMGGGMMPPQYGAAPGAQCFC